MAIGSHGRGRGGTVGHLDGSAVGRRARELFSFSGVFGAGAVAIDLHKHKQSISPSLSQALTHQAKALQLNQTSRPVNP
jgi:hypothetical protein